MPLPNGFSAWEHLQSVLMLVHNRRVREEFSDLGDDWDDDITIPRGSLRVACTLKDDDTSAMTLLRMWVFYVILGQAAAMHPGIYGIPVPSFQEARKFHPQIQLYFQEDNQDLEPGFAPVTGEISFRLMSQSSETLTEAEVRTYANKVQSLFGLGAGFVWQKGKVMASYTDRKKGYQLRLLCRTDAEARRVVEQVLDIQGDTPDWKHLNVSQNAEPSASYPTVPPNDFILGRNRRLPRQRPIASVRFKYALLHVHGVPHPIVLVDLSRIFRNPIVLV